MRAYAKIPGMAETTRMTLIEGVGLKTNLPNHLEVELPLLKVLKDFTDSGWSFWRVTSKDSADIKKGDDVIRLTRIVTAGKAPEMNTSVRSDSDTA